MATKQKEYRREFFDRDYAVRAIFPRLWRYMRKYRGRILLGLFCGLVSAGTLMPFYQMVQPAVAEVPITERHAEMPKAMRKAARLPGWFRTVENVATKAGIVLQREDGAMSGGLLLIVFLVLPAICGLRLLMTFLNQYCLVWAMTKTTADLRAEMLAHVQRQSMQFQGRIDVGQLLSRLTADPSLLVSLFPTLLGELAVAPFEILVSVWFIVSFALRNHLVSLLAILLVAVPLFVVPVAALGRKMRKWTKTSLERTSVAGSDVHEVLTCVRTVKAFHAEEQENRVFRNVYDQLNKAVLRALRLGLLTGPLVESIGIVLIGVALVGCFCLHLPVVGILPLLAPVFMIYRPIKELSRLQVQIQDAMAGLSRIFSLLDCHLELKEPAQPKTVGTFHEAVRFEDVVFKYDAAETNAVDHVSFAIPRGAKVAVVGATGSGKSTLGALLSRFYDPQGGRITVDGVDLRDLASAEVHRLVGSVLQETFLFNDTIEANIRYGLPNATHAEVEAAARAAHAEEFILSQPGGYQRVCGEKGFVLSGGERQRLAIARAILLNPPILLLDEATSALDTVTEHLVQEALERLMANRTVLSIAHRLSTVRAADLILVMDHGRVVERGTHDELLAAGGAYARLCQARA